MASGHVMGWARLAALVMVVPVVLFRSTPAGGQPDEPKPEEPPLEVRPLEVDDPLLDPPAPAPRVLAHWQDALRLVRGRSTDLVVAVQEIERAEGRWREALGRALPMLTADGSVRHHLIRNEGQRFDSGSGTVVTETLPPTPVVTGSVSLSQPILAVREWYSIGTAERAIEASRLRAEDARRLILGSVAGALLAVVTAERLTDVNRSGLKTALERLELERRRAGHGAGTRLRLMRFEQDVARSRAAVIDGDEALVQAREALGLALGLAEPVGIGSRVRVRAIEQLLKRACRSGNVRTRPDVKAAEAELRVAERNVTDADLLAVPFAVASTTATTSNQELENRGHVAWTIGATLTIPLYDGGVRYGVRRQAAAVREQQRARLDQTKREARVEVSQAVRGQKVAEAQRAVARERRDFAREAARLTAIAFEQGAATSFELVETARDEREAELELVLRDFELVQARVTALLAAARCEF
jgi:outer membrane protein TolC